MINRLKDFLYRLVLAAATMGRRQTETKRALLVKTDEIGDYFLWRKCIEPIVNSDLLKGYAVDFVGNASWRKITEAFDAAYFSDVYWMDKTKFKKELRYRYLFLRNIYRRGYDVVIDPIYSRDPRFDEAVVAAACARIRMGMNRNTENIRGYERNRNAKLFNKVFEWNDFPVFEWHRNKAFAEFIAERKIEIENTLLNADQLPVVAGLPAHYFVVFPGSRSSARIWSTDNFIRVAHFLWEQYGFTAVVCGSAGDKKYSDAFVERYDGECIDLTGKTNLLEMLGVLKNAQCLISVDTGAIHMAAAVGCRVYGIFNGSQYGRFAPYPQSVAANVFSIYPDEIEKELQQIDLVRKKYTFTVPVSYDTVSAEKLIKQIKETMFIK